MRAILNQPWRESFVANDEMLYNTFERDLIDPTVRENSIKILGSRVQIETLDFNSEISGVIIEGEEDSASNVAFSIDIVRKVISHSCSEYDQSTKKSKTILHSSGTGDLKIICPRSESNL